MQLKLETSYLVMKNKKTLAIDFDGVIHKYSKKYYDGTIYDKPIKNAKKALKKLAKLYKIVIFTTRLNPCFDEVNKEKGVNVRKDILEWLKKNEFKKNIHWHELTNNKPAAIAYIDDRGIRFTNWQDILNYYL